jgi:hypothetical protein
MDSDSRVFRTKQVLNTQSQYSCHAHRAQSFDLLPPTCCSTLTSVLLLPAFPSVTKVDILVVVRHYCPDPLADEDAGFIQYHVKH